MDIDEIVRTIKGISRKLTVAFILPFSFVFVLSGLTMQYFNSGEYGMFAVFFALTVIVPYVVVSAISRSLWSDVRKVISLYMAYKIESEIRKKIDKDIFSGREQ